VAGAPACGSGKYNLIYGRISSEPGVPLGNGNQSSNRASPKVEVNKCPDVSGEEVEKI
jgi:hypothetical protein